MSGVIPLTGEPLALDLINTRAHAADGVTDLLATPEQLRNWLALQADRIPDVTVDRSENLTAADIAAVHAVRAHTTAAIDHVRRRTPPPAAALRRLTEAQAAAPAINELIWNGSAVTAVQHRAGPLGARLAARLAEAAGNLLTDPAVVNIRECEADDCVMLFLPAHPRRRWCSATRCGNRARVARYYQRHKTS